MRSEIKNLHLAIILVLLFVFVAVFMIWLHIWNKQDTATYDLVPEKDISRKEIKKSADIMQELVHAKGYNPQIKVENGRISVEGPPSFNKSHIPHESKPFRAVIGNETIFTGEDIKSVCESAGCSYAENPKNPCGKIENGSWQCEFIFKVNISESAGHRIGQATSQLEINDTNRNEILNETLRLYLGDELVHKLKSSSELKGREIVHFTVSGPGIGNTKIKAREKSFQNMRELQIYLSTEPLPCDFEVKKV